MCGCICKTLSQLSNDIYFCPFYLLFILCVQCYAYAYELLLFFFVSVIKVLLGIQSSIYLAVQILSEV